MIRPTQAWLGPVVNAPGQPLDGKGPLPLGRVAHRLHGAPPPAHRRRRACGSLSTDEHMAELIRIGTYKSGSDPAIDGAIRYDPRIEAFLAQDRAEGSDFETADDELAKILGRSVPGISGSVESDAGARGAASESDVRAA